MAGPAELNCPKTIWVLLAALAKRQPDWGIHSRENGARRIRDQVQRHFNPVSFEILEHAAANIDSAFPKQTFLHLPPDDRGGWKQPILRASFETNGGHRVFRVKTAILVEHLEPNASGEQIPVHRGIGLRFESQEGPAGQSSHDYAHAQWFCAFERGTGGLPGCPAWLPEVHPAIPIPADNAVDILCCALKSLYGARSEPLCWLAATVKTPVLNRSLGVQTQQRINSWAGMA